MAAPWEFHHLVKRGEFERVRELSISDINAYDNRGRTPLMYAVESRRASVELVRWLLEQGADVRQECSQYKTQYSMAALCLAGRDPRKLEVLLEHGADIHYVREHGYDALIDAASGAGLEREAGLLDLLRIVLDRGVVLDRVSSYGEAALTILSCVGRFDAVRLLLEAGADESRLRWTPLMRAIALGSLAGMEAAFHSGANLEAVDARSRTAWLVAIQTGDIAKASFLLERGAATGASGHCGKTSLAHAIENYRAAMLQWLLELGAPIDETDDFDKTPLMCAVECGNAEAVDILLNAGADRNAENSLGETAMGSVQNRDIAIRLMRAGADLNELSFQGRRAWLGFEPEPDEAFLDASASDFRQGRSRRFGNSNPEKISEPFWENMIRAGISAHQGASLFGEVRHASPVWCARRFGQSITLLLDGRVVQIAGEHEDYYDPDFCIYNDVFVHEPDGAIHIFGYPEAVFPPTDFHTATLVGEYVYMVGSLGYQGTRRYGETPIYRLHTKTFRIEPVQAGGRGPGWIYKHRVELLAPDEIQIAGGQVVTREGDDETHTQNERVFVLDTKRLMWRVAEA